MQTRTVSTAFSFLLAALLLLLPLQSAAQAAGDISPTSLCPTPVLSQNYPEPDLLTSIPTSAEVCIPYGEISDNGKIKQVYVKITTPLRPSNLVYDSINSATGPRSSDDPNISVTFACPTRNGETKNVEAPGTCDAPNYPNSAIVKFDYDYTTSSRNEKILFASSISPSNFFSVESPLTTVTDEALNQNTDDIGSPTVPPRLASTATMICSDGSYVRPPIACKRRS